MKKIPNNNIKICKEKPLEELQKIGLKVLDLDEQRNNTIDRKSQALLSFTSVLIPIFIALYFNVIKDIDNSYKLIFKLLFIAILSVLIISIFFSLLVLLSRKFKQIDFSKIWETEKKLKISEINELKEGLLDHFHKIHQHNKKIIDSKNKFLLITFILTFIDIIVIVIFFSFFALKL